MADNVAKVTLARNFAIAQLIVGFLLFCFGIGEQVVEKLISQRTYLGFIAGIWVLITGCLGIPGTRKEPTFTRDGFAATFLFLSLLSAVLGGALAVIYSIFIVFHGVDEWGNRILEENKNYDAKITILAMILILGILECCIGCLAHVSVYRMLMICCFSSPTPQGQVRYPSNSAYVVTEASQMQVNGGPQGGQPQTFYGTSTSRYQPQRINMPPSYKEGQYVTQQNQQASSSVPVAVRMQEGATFVPDQTVTPEAQDIQPQIVLLPDSREMDDLPPPYEAALSGYHVLQVDMPQSQEKEEHFQWKTYV